jgi:hypothetical protein
MGIIGQDGMAMRWVSVVCLAVVLAACGGGGSGPESASAAASRQFGYIAKAQWGRHWDELHPGQQAIASKDAYIACQQKKSVPITNTKAIDEYDEPIDVPGVASQVPAKAVTMEYTANGQTDHVTIHEVQVDGKWHWLLDPDSITAYQTGKCP